MSHPWNFTIPNVDSKLDSYDLEMQEMYSREFPITQKRVQMNDFQVISIKSIYGIY